MNRDGRRYHHGDLPAALIAAGLELARSGGAEAIGLREVTRVVGVTPNAAYRHFADRRALVLAVAARAQQQLALAMEDRMADADTEPDSGRRARQRLRAVGLAYIDFAVGEPGWFQLAFFTHEHYAEAGTPKPARRRRPATPEPRPTNSCSPPSTTSSPPVSCPPTAGPMQDGPAGPRSTACPNSPPGAHSTTNRPLLSIGSPSTSSTAPSKASSQDNHPPARPPERRPPERATGCALRGSAGGEPIERDGFDGSHDDHDR